jgi:hypothetical protein
MVSWVERETVLERRLGKEGNRKRERGRGKGDGEREYEWRQRRGKKEEREEGGRCRGKHNSRPFF